MIFVPYMILNGRVLIYDAFDSEQRAREYVLERVKNMLDRVEVSTNQWVVYDNGRYMGTFGVEARALNKEKTWRKRHSTNG